MRNMLSCMLAIVFLTLGCQNSTIEKTSNLNEIQTGGIQIIPIQTPKGKFNVWTKRNGNNPTTKVLLLHGGPACTHEYFECFESFLPKEDIEFIYYDQLGSYYSDQPKDSSLWTTDRFVNEVEQVRQALGLTKDNFILLGHSWGGILAMAYAEKYQKHLKALVISNMMASCPEYGKYSNDVLSKTIDSNALAKIRQLETEGKTSDTSYMNLLMPNFYKKHICRLNEWPDPINRTFKHLNAELYTCMQGPSEFGISGRLKNWDFSNKLKDIKVPTLVIGAKYDTMDPLYMEWMAKQIPNGQFLLCPNGSHMAFYDDQDTYFRGLLKFIKNIKAKI